MELAVYSQMQLGLGALDSVRCARPASGEQASLGTWRRRTTINHRTVGGAPDCPVSRPQWSRRSRETFNDVRLKFTGLSGEAPYCRVSQRSTAPTVGRAIRARRVGASMVGRGTGLFGVHRTVSGAPTARNQQQSDAPEKEGARAPDSYRDCPVRHPTEGKICLPKLPPTAPSCLRAIKGTPRRMESSTKHSLIIPKHQDSILTHSILWDSDLSSIWVENSLCCVLSLSCGLFAWLCSRFESCVCCSPLPYFRASLWSSSVRVRGYKLWRFLANGRKYKKGKHRGIQVDHWITWKGLSATLVH
jgi:hypothetical protein